MSNGFAGLQQITQDNLKDAEKVSALMAPRLEEERGAPRRQWRGSLMMPTKRAATQALKAAQAAEPLSPQRGKVSSPNFPKYGRFYRAFQGSQCAHPPRGLCKRQRCLGSRSGMYADALQVWAIPTHFIGYVLVCCHTCIQIVAITEGQPSPLTCSDYTREAG